jgi:hypothetical protein
MIARSISARAAASLRCGQKTDVAGPVTTKHNRWHCCEMPPAQRRDFKRGGGETPQTNAVKKMPRCNSYFGFLLFLVCPARSVLSSSILVIGTPGLISYEVAHARAFAGCLPFASQHPAVHALSSVPRDLGLRSKGVAGLFTGKNRRYSAKRGNQIGCCAKSNSRVV